ncbi:hypothetical protein R6242_04610 [Iodobacter sp. CM08]|uniref:fimbrial protein n=1 Tax=Iodobacter sp. CM08 TaxID=3085902 RepID=UPI002982390B|nr:hypothetical protein [Iodobacter sp. CM08]MDW5415853.1 hypothetical protein [Iodobacter sp. CM08]
MNKIFNFSFFILFSLLLGSDAFAAGDVNLVVRLKGSVFIPPRCVFNMDKDYSVDLGKVDIQKVDGEPSIQVDIPQQCTPGLGAAEYLVRITGTFVGTSNVLTTNHANLGLKLLVNDQTVRSGSNFLVNSINDKLKLSIAPTKLDAAKSLAPGKFLANITMISIIR